MIVDLNDQDYLNALKKAASSNDGQIVLEFIKWHYNKIDFNDLDATRANDIVGADFRVMKSVKEWLSDILKLLEN